MKGSQGGNPEGSNSMDITNKEIKIIMGGDNEYFVSPSPQKEMKLPKDNNNTPAFAQSSGATSVGGDSRHEPPAAPKGNNKDLSFP